MIGIIKKSLGLLSILFVLGLFFTSKANAASLSNASDTLSTSRPSAAAPLSADQAGGSSLNSVTVVDLPTSGFNSALWLASDSATIQADTGQTQDILKVASMSASSSNTRILYFTTNIPNAHHKGTTVITPITAMHTIKFGTGTSIPIGGKIILAFPTVTSNIASPSATGFSFNGSGLTTSNIKCNPSNACNAVSVSGNTITLTTATSIVTGTVYIDIGCSGSVDTSGVCTGSQPLLINPIKTSAAAGTNDSWSIGITTTDASNNPLDTSTVVAGTIESVQVQGTVQPYITFTISGVSAGSTISTFNSNCTANGDVLTGGSNATFVNFGTIGQTFSLAAQNLAVSTNGSGYSITATSSGQFINPSTGFFFPGANSGGGLTAVDTPIPAVVVAGTTSFGIHPCGTDTYTGITWGTGGAGAAARFSNPFNTGTNAFYSTLSTLTGTPQSARTTTVEYEATAASAVPAGTYSTVFTYVATPIF